MYCFSVQLKDKGPHMWFPDLTFLLRNALNINCLSAVSSGIWTNKLVQIVFIKQAQVDSVLKIHIRLATWMSRALLEPHCFRNVQNGPKWDTKLEKYIACIGNRRWTVLILFFLNKCFVFNLSLEIISGESPPTVWVNAPTRIYCGFCMELDRRFLASLALCPHVCIHLCMHVCTCRTRL